jgi:hypothetical protein
MKIAYIKWKDAVQELGDTESSVSFEDPLIILEEIGWIVGESEDAISICMELEGDNLPGRWRLHIPRINIEEMRTMEFEKFPKKKTKVL